MARFIQTSIGHTSPRSRPYSSTQSATLGPVSYTHLTAEDKKRVREMIRYTQSEVTEVRLQFGKLVEVQPNPWSAGGIRVLYSN